jgi:hypothetical protein
MAAMLGLCAAPGWGLTDFLPGPTARCAGIGATMRNVKRFRMACGPCICTLRSFSLFARNPQALHALSDTFAS